MTDLVHPEDRRHSEETSAKVYSGKGELAQGYTRMRTKTGQYRWVSGWAEPVFDETGSPVGDVAGVQNIDDLMTTRIRLQATLDTEFGPHVLLEAVRDDAGRIEDFLCVETNPAACANTGRARGDLVGARMREVLAPIPFS